MDKEILLGKLKGQKALLEERLADYTRRLSEAEGAMQSWSSRLRQDIETERNAVSRQLEEISAQIDEITAIKLDQAVKVVAGCLVTLDFGGEKETYRLLKSAGNPEHKIISAASPIGRAVLGKEAGEEVEVKTENGPTKIKILNVTC